MSQFDFGDLESPLSGTAFINTYLEPWRDALHSQHSGNSRPSYAVGGMIWLDTTTQPWLLKMFNGTANDVTLGRIDPTNFWFEPTGISEWAGSAGGTANAITLTPTIPWTSYATGKPFECLITATNTSETVTVNVSALGTKNVKTSIGVGKVNIPKGALQNGMIARMVYDGTDLVLLNVRANNRGSNIATASTVNLDAATGDYVLLTGTTTVTAITLAEGQQRVCVCEGAFTLTDGSGSSPQGIICPGGANIATAAGDVFIVRGEANGTVRVIHYQVAASAPGGGSGQLITVDVFTGSGTWNKPAGCNAAEVWATGGGAAAGNAGSAASAGGAGGGGGGGGTAYKYITSGLGSTETVTIGAGGTISGSAGGNGGNGGNTSFGSHITGNGGTGGTGSGASGSAAGQAAGGAGGTGSGSGATIFQGADGGYASWEYSDGQATGGNGGASMHGGGGYGGDLNVSGAGPNSIAGTDGNNYGGGGGGSAVHGNTDVNSGAGAGGIVIVKSYT